MCKWSNNRGYCFPDPGEAQDINCGICAEKMNVKRGIFGPTGFIEAMSPRGGHWHDYFECPNLGELWHKHIVSLTDEQMKTNSAKIKQILEDEIQETLKTKKMPKLVGRAYASIS